MTSIRFRLPVVEWGVASWGSGGFVVLTRDEAEARRIAAAVYGGEVMRRVDGGRWEAAG